jgi:SHS2 domain-containing protein
MYETFEHTADLGLRVRAVSMAELFADAARGLLSVMVADLAAVRSIQAVSFRLQSESIEDLWHDWLSELLYAFHGRRLVLSEFAVDIRRAEVCDPDDAGATGSGPPLVVLSATARGEPIDSARHEIAVEVKAVTWHGLRVEQQPDGWLGEVILDI